MAQLISSLSVGFHCQQISLSQPGLWCPVYQGKEPPLPINYKSRSMTSSSNWSRDGSFSVKLSINIIYWWEKKLLHEDQSLKQKQNKKRLKENCKSKHQIKNKFQCHSKSDLPPPSREIKSKFFCFKSINKKQGFQEQKQIIRRKKIKGI